MIFSADLDRTLIFSQKRLKPGAAVVPAEFRLGEPYGFMTPGALAAMRALTGRCTCLINTLRGFEQARRVSFVADGSCRYLALQNGLALYRDGVLDTGWSRLVRAQVDALPLSLTDGAARVLGELDGIECLSKQYEHLAVFFVEEGRFDDAACTALAGELAALGWELCRQRKKLYLSPLAIDKGAVLKRVQELEGDGFAACFGDSCFDLPMLRAAERAYSLCGCELDGGDWGFMIHFSTRPAQEGTEDILTELLRLPELRNRLND